MKYSAYNMHHSCLRKKKYITEGWAKHMAIEMSEKFKKNYKAYYCPLCHGWHLATVKDKYDEVSE